MQTISGSVAPDAAPHVDIEMQRAPEQDLAPPDPSASLELATAAMPLRHRPGSRIAASLRRHAGALRDPCAGAGSLIALAGVGATLASGVGLVRWAKEDKSEYHYENYDYDHPPSRISPHVWSFWTLPFAVATTLLGACIVRVARMLR